MGPVNLSFLEHGCGTGSQVLLAAPISIQAYYINYQQPENIQDRQVTEFSQPITVEFDYDAN